MVAIHIHLRPDISVTVKQNCVGWHDARLTEIKRHTMQACKKTVHAEDIINTWTPALRKKKGARKRRRKGKPNYELDA